MQTIKIRFKCSHCEGERRCDCRECKRARKEDKELAKNGGNPCSICHATGYMHLLPGEVAETDCKHCRATGKCDCCSCEGRALHLAEERGEKLRKLQGGSLVVCSLCDGTGVRLRPKPGAGPEVAEGGFRDTE